MTSAVVEASGIVKRFGPKPVLNGVSFTVPAKSVFAFLGNNGAGKSTTIRVLTGLLKPDAGTITVLGRNMPRDRKALLRDIGCLVDSPSLYPNLNASEFLSIACTLKNLPMTEIPRVLELVDLQSAARTRLAHFSLGMRQRIALAHALIGRPKLLVLDEPTNGLDPHGIIEIRQLLQRLPELGDCTVFVSSHQLDEVEKVATDVALLQGGRVISQGPIRTLMGEGAVLALDVDDAAVATALLGRHQYDARVTSEHTVEVHGVERRHADRVHALLCANAVRLYESIHKKPSLEEWFLRSTTMRPQENAC